MPVGFEVVFKYRCW